MNALEVRELTKVYPEFTLDKVSFFVKQGHISGLIGRNGASYCGVSLPERFGRVENFEIRLDNRPV